MEDYLRYIASGKPGESIAERYNRATEIEKIENILFDKLDYLKSISMISEEKITEIVDMMNKGNYKDAIDAVKKIESKIQSKAPKHD